MVAKDDHNVAPLAVAEVLALAPKQVHVIYPTNGPAVSLGRHTLGPALARLSAAGVTWTFMERVTAVEGGCVHTRNVYSNLPGGTETADSVVLACGSEAESELVDALRPLLAEVYVLGDAYAPRRISPRRYRPACWWRAWCPDDKGSGSGEEHGTGRRRLEVDGGRPSAPRTVRRSSAGTRSSTARTTSTWRHSSRSG